MVPKWWSEMNNERAVSEVVGFVLVFSLIVATIGIVYTTGLGGLQDTRDVERVNNAERAFDVLANNFQTLARGNAPNRATEIKLSDAELELGNRLLVNTSATGLNSNAEAAARPLTYRVEDSEIVYERGAVIRVDDGGEGVRMIREPDLMFDEERTVIRYILPRGGTQHISGDATVLVRAQVSVSDVILPDTGTADDPGIVTYRMETADERADVWEAYLEDEIPDGGTCTTDSAAGDDGITEVSCEFGTDRLHVTQTILDVQIVP